MKKRVFSSIMSIILIISLCLGSTSAVVTAAPAPGKTITATFEIVNQTASDITSLKLAPAGEDPVSRELLAKPLKSGAKVNVAITFNPNIESYDLVFRTADLPDWDSRFEQLDFRGITAASGGLIIFQTLDPMPGAVIFNKAGAAVAGLALGSDTSTVAFSFKNQTDKEIDCIQLSLPDKEEWGQNLLKAPLLAGATADIPITFSPKNAKWDIRVGGNMGNTAEDVDFTGITAANGGNILLGSFDDYRGVLAYSKVAPKAGLPVGNGTMTVNFNVKNETTADYTSLQLSPAGKKAWSPNLLTTPLKAGTTVVIPITYSDKAALWDLKGTNLDGSFDVLADNLDFSPLTPESGANIGLQYSLYYGSTALVSNNRAKVPYPKQSGNSIMFFDTDSDGVLSSYETKEQLKAANPNLQAGIDASISDKVTTIGKYAFNFMPVKKLTLPSSVTTILDEAFANNRMLTDIHFSEGLVTTGYGAFLKTGIKSVTLPKSIRTIGDMTFNDCGKLAEINLPEGLTTIGNGAFGWTPITGIRLPDSVTTLGDGAFTYCTSLKSISIPANIKRINEGTFTNCTALTDAKLPAVTSIGDFAFIGCTSLTNVSMPIVTSIEDYAFKGCASLMNIQLPATLNSIGINPFLMADKLVAISLDPANQSFVIQDEGILYSKDLTKVYAYPNARTAKTLVLPATVTTINAEAFSYTSIENVTLPAGIKTVETGAFGASQLKSLLLPEGIENIGSSAFASTPIAGELVIPKSVKTMGTYAFFASNIKSAIINSSIDLSDNIFGRCQNLETVEINDSVKKIGKFAFMSCTRLKNVILPKSLKVIRSAAFKSCTGLVEISLPEGLTNVGEDVPAEDRSGANAEDYGVFMECTSLKKINLPDSIEYIEDSSFEECTSLKSIKLPLNAKYKKIEYRTFAFCGLDFIFIPKNVITIGDSSFWGAALKKMTIAPWGCKYIGHSAFNHSNLEEVIIPDGVIELAPRSFNNIKPLKTVTLSSTLGMVETFTFFNIPNCTRINLLSIEGYDIAIFNFEDEAFLKYGKIHIPKNSKAGYKAQNGNFLVEGRSAVADLPALPEEK